MAEKGAPFRRQAEAQEGIKEETNYYYILH